MTLKQKRFVEELPKNNYNVCKSAKKAGYSDSYANKSIYTDLGKNRILEKFYNEDNIRKEIKKALKDYVRSKDNTNRTRVLELITKILGMITERAEVTQLDKQENQFSLDRLSRIKQVDKQ